MHGKLLVGGCQTELEKCRRKHSKEDIDLRERQEQRTAGICRWWMILLLFPRLLVFIVVVTDTCSRDFKWLEIHRDKRVQRNMTEKEGRIRYKACLMARPLCRAFGEVKGVGSQSAWLLWDSPANQTDGDEGRYLIATNWKTGKGNRKWPCLLLRHEQ